MGKETITIKRPKYHPQTGVLLEGDYEFDFPIATDRFLVNKLIIENSQLKKENHDLKNSTNEASKALDALSKELNDLRSKNLFIKECRQLRYKYREQVKLIKELRACL